MDQRVVGRGKLYFEPENSATPGERYIGNTPSLVVSRKIKTVRSSKSVRGVLVESDPRVIGEENSVSFETDNISDMNLKIWFGDQSTKRQEFGAFSLDIVAWRGNHYQLGATDLDPVGFANLVSASVDFNGVNVSSDCEVDLITGRLYIPEDSTIGDGSLLTVSGVRASTFASSTTPSASEVIGKLRFVSENPTTRQVSIVWPRIALVPDGDFDIKAASGWVSMGFAGSVRKIPGAQYAYAYSWDQSGRMWPGGPDLLDFLATEDRLNTLVNITMPGRGYPV